MDRPLILCPCPLPKRLLTSSSWKSRNDSSNISAILYPEDSSPRLKLDEKTRGDVIVKQLLSGNNCYCRCKAKLPRPSFFKRPNSCTSMKVLDKSTLTRRSLSGCVCVDDDTTATKIATRSGETSLKPTAQRLVYDAYRQTEEDKFRKELQDYELEMAVGDSDKVDTLLNPQIFQTSSSFSNYPQQTISDDLSTHLTCLEQSIPNFRKEHFFETHDIGKFELTGNIPRDHICVHQYKLDEKQLPEAVNKGVFGRSVCRICGKPMNCTSVDRSPKIHSNKSNFYQTTVNMDKGNSKIEVLVNENDMRKSREYVEKLKKPVYRCSLALRHQKLRVV
ncbi:uncharacterized protein [Euwallacea similis]|uniref:uncharacterized protein n=1 Tax=Euwallacea similis TaxID=1736056 RepID=UPI0034510442